MVCWNSAEAEIDEEKGEIVLVSRHKLEKGNKELCSKNYPKIYGAVSVLLVEQNTGTFGSNNAETCNESVDDIEMESSIKIGRKSSTVLGDITNGLNKIAIPASLSLIPIPLLGLPGTNFQTQTDHSSKPEISKDANSQGSPSYHSPSLKYSDPSNNEDSLPADCTVIVLDSASLDSDHNNANPEPHIVPNVSNGFNVSNQYQVQKGREEENHPPLYRMQASMMGIQDRKTTQLYTSSHASNHSNFHGQEKQQKIIDRGPKSNMMHSNSGTKIEQEKLQGISSHGNNTHDSCLYCHMKINELDEIVNHALTNHEVKPDELMVILCPLCKGTFSKHDLHEFMEHVKIHIGSRKNRPSLVKNAQKFKKPNKQNNSVQSNFIENYHNRSVNRHFDNRKLQFNSSQKLGGLKVRLGLKKDATKPVRYQRKLVRVSSSNPKTCIHCDQRIVSYREIMRHNKMHGYPDMCPICSRSFSIRSGLLRHCMTHIQSRVYNCHYCSAIFTRNDNLSRHVATVHLKNSKENGTPTLNENSGSSQVQNSSEKSSSEVADDTELFSQTFSEFEDKLADDLGTANRAEAPELWDMSDTSLHNKFENTISKDEIAMKNQVENEKDLHKETTSTETGSNQIYTQKERSIDMNISEPELSTLNFNCSTCEMNFPTLDQLKRHVVFTHAELVNDDANSSQQDEIEHFSIPASQRNSESNESQNVISLESYTEKDDPSDDTCDDSTFQHVRIKQEFDESEVIDIENLGEFTEFQSQYSQNVKLENPGDLSRNSEFSNDTDHVGAPSGERAQQSVSSYMDSYVMMNSSGNSVGEFYRDINSVPSATVSRSSDYDMDNSYMQQHNITTDENNSNIEMFLNTQGDDLSVLSVLGLPTQSTQTQQKKRKRNLTNTLSICYFCEMYLDSAGSIVRHGDTHKDLINSSNTCTICLTELGGRDSLHRHASSHVGTLFNCNFCDNKFSRKDNLKRHIRKVHPDSC